MAPPNSKTNLIIKADSPWRFEHTQVRNPETNRQRKQYVVKLHQDIALHDLRLSTNVEMFFRKHKVNGEEIDIEDNACEIPNDVILRKDSEMYGSNAYDRNVVESWLIQAFGKKWNQQCTKCTQGKGSYEDCVTLEGLLGGTCGNCKRLGKATECTFNELNMSEQERRVNEECQRGLAEEMGRRVITGHTPDRELIEGIFPGRT